MRGTDMHKIVLLDKPRENPGELDWSPLQALGETTFYAHTEPEEAAARIGDAEIVLLNKTVLTAETLRQCKNLKLISVIATGYNTVDVDCCRELGITVCNVPSYGSEAISQNAIALLLELTNRVAHHDAEVRKGRSGGPGASGTTPLWNSRARLPGSSVSAASGGSPPASFVRSV